MYLRNMEEAYEAFTIQGAGSAVARPRMVRLLHPDRSELPGFYRVLAL